VAAFDRNRWPLWIGLGGRLPSESLAALPRNPQSIRPPSGIEHDIACKFRRLDAFLFAHKSPRTLYELTLLGPSALKANCLRRC
jgi:hypothetical protein